MKIICPSCRFENIEGEDRCAECFYSLMNVDLPKPRKKDSLQYTLMTAPVSEIMSDQDLLVASKDDTIAKVVQILKDKQKRCVLIYDKHKLVGILSERRLLTHVAGKYLDLGKVTVEEVMTPNPEFVYAEDPVVFAVNKMSVGGFRHVPVLAKDGKPLSLLTIKEVLSYLSNATKKK